MLENSSEVIEMFFWGSTSYEDVINVDVGWNGMESPIVPGP